MQIHSKLPNVGTTIFTVMSALAKEHHALNLSQGFPDFECNPLLIELAAKYMRDGQNQYAPMTGIQSLRETISEILKTCYNADYNTETEITVTAGATQGIYTSIAAFINPGDEVLVFEPAYDCYIPAIELHGGIPIPIELKYPGFSIDWDLVEEKISDKTRMIIINSPHNPSGSILSSIDLKKLDSMVANKDIIIISDEVYEHMVFDNATHEGVAKYPSLKNKSLLISSFGKTIHTTGWKIGYVAAPEYLMKEFRKVHQFLVFAVNHPLQLAIAEFLSDKKNYLELKTFYQKKRDYFLNLIKDSRFVPEKCAGTYFQLVSYKNISDLSDSEMAKKLTIENKIATIPLSGFYTNKTDNKLLRICFAKKEETLEAAAEILNKI
ncbi:MAG: methionine aminotransferase [Bacteroidia bacterium]